MQLIKKIQLSCIQSVAYILKTNRVEEYILKKPLSFIKSTLEDVLYFCSIVTYPDGFWEKVIEIIQPGE